MTRPMLGYCSAVNLLLAVENLLDDKYKQTSEDFNNVVETLENIGFEVKRSTVSDVILELFRNPPCQN